MYASGTKLPSGAISTIFPSSPSDQGCYQEPLGVVPYQAQIGEGIVLGYQACGMVIHKLGIGRNCHISQNVTIGGISGLYEVPVLGDNVQVGSGAVIIGPVHIGGNVIIGANAVVNKSIPPNSVAVGVSARVILTLDPDVREAVWAMEGEAD